MWLTNLRKYYYNGSAKINKILFWNVDAKLRLLLLKVAKGYIDFVDVSPGHYCFEEMNLETIFTEGIYYGSKQYHEDLYKMVFKYNVDKNKIPFYDILKDKTHYIQNGVYLDLNDKTVKDEGVLNSLQPYVDKNDGIINLIVCGRIAPSKHLETIFKAFILAKKEPNVYLHIVGSVEPEYEDYYKSLDLEFSDHFGKTIVFHGQCDNSSLIMKSMDGLIVLGTHQGCPNIILEAFSVGVPVIANDSGGTGEIVNQSNGILIHEKISIENLKNLIEEFIRIKSQMKEKGLAGKILIEKQFSMDKMKQEYLKQIIFEN